MSTLLRASSHMSQELSFHTWVAMLYSSISGSYTGQGHSSQVQRALPPSPSPGELPGSTLHSPSRGQHWPWDPSASGCLLPRDSYLGEVELQGVVSGQRDHEAAGQILGERVPVIAEEEAVIAERGHGDADLGQVIQVLQDRGLGR